MENVLITYLNKGPIRLTEIGSMLVTRLFGGAAFSPKNFPKSLPGYSFAYELANPNESSKFRIGVYRAKTGERAFLKLWEGKYRDSAYYALKNELQFYRLLTHTRIIGGHAALDGLTEVQIPRLLQSIEGAHRIALLLSEIKGDAISAIPEEGRLLYAQKSLAFMDSLHEACLRASMQERARMATFTVSISHKLFLLFALLAFVRHPNLVRKIAAGVWKYFSYARKINTQPEYALVHRDLTDTNILLDNGRLSIFDFESVLFAPKALEISQILVSVCDRPSLFALHKVLAEPFLRDPQQRPMYICMSLYGALLHIATEQQYALHDYIRYFDYVLNL